MARNNNNNNLWTCVETSNGCDDWQVTQYGPVILPILCIKGIVDCGQVEMARVPIHISCAGRVVYRPNSSAKLYYYVILLSSHWHYSDCSNVYTCIIYVYYKWVYTNNLVSIYATVRVLLTYIFMYRTYLRMF